MTDTITAIVLAKNEEKNIAKCLASLNWCSEIIVIDDFSTDKTVDIATKYGAKVYIHSLDGDFSQQRNYGLQKAKNEWVFFVDADEEVSLSLQYEITNHLGNQFTQCSGFYIKRVDEMWGRKLRHGEVGNSILLRLAKKDAGLWQKKVHEVWKIKGKTMQLQNVLLHYPHPTVATFLSEINFYSTLRAQELIQGKVRVRSWDVVIYPLAKFMKNYIIKLGFMDGVAGLILTIMMSFHSFLVRSKAWLAYENNKK